MGGGGARGVVEARGGPRAGWEVVVEVFGGREGHGVEVGGRGSPFGVRRQGRSLPGVGVG